jgi:hypothetical protein
MFMTYNSLLTEVQAYLDRYDEQFINNIPRFVYQAHDRINADCKNIGLEQIVTSNFTVGDPVITKPGRWRRTLNINYGSGTENNDRTIISLRGYDYLLLYWPDLTELGAPEYYADYGFTSLIVVPTPEFAYPFELSYLELPQPLTEENQTNWLTNYAPSLLLYATLLEAVIYLKDYELIQAMDGEYTKRAIPLGKQDDARKTDRSSNRDSD